VDPTSPYSGGAILGDRVRMSRHASDDSVFIRSLATRGHMGGLSRSARDVARVFDAAGYNIVLIETVGVGQDEVEIASAAHSTLVVVAPGMGDGVQAMKAGILECADAFAVNKADREGADASARDLELMLSLNAPATLQAAFRADHGGTGAGRGLANRVATEGGEEAGWLPSVVKCIASRGDGVDGVVAALDQHRSWLGTRAGRARLRARLAQEVRASLREALVSAALLDLAPEIEAAVDAIETRSMDPYSATDRLMARFRARPG
jgi:LAO/AO transport system kinase